MNFYSFLSRGLKVSTLNNSKENIWVIVFRGIPRAGKTTLAKALHHKLEDRYKIALIHYDNIFEMKKGGEKDRLKPVIATGMIEDFLTDGFNLILDYSFLLVQPLRETIRLIEKYTSRYRIYFLKPSFLTIIKRDRNFPAPKGIEVLRDYWLAMLDNDSPGCIEIDTGRFSIDESVRFILNDLESNLLKSKELSILGGQA